MKKLQKKKKIQENNENAKARHEKWIRKMWKRRERKGGKSR